MKKHLLKLGLLTILTVSLLGCNSGDNYKSNSGDYAPATNISGDPAVKKSTTGICHEEGSTYYDRTKNFQPYNSIEDCLNSGGRLPKR
jgi:hypothetical protein